MTCLSKLVTTCSLPLTPSVRPIGEQSLKGFRAVVQLALPHAYSDYVIHSGTSKTLTTRTQVSMILWR